MSKPGALSKKELAEAGRKKLEEFKRKKQQKTTEPGAGSSDATISSSSSATVATHTSSAARPALSLASPAGNTPCSEAAAPPAVTATASPVVPQPASTPWIPSLPQGNDSSIQSSAARAAAAGAAAAALEAALMGLPSATPAPAPATMPKPAVAPAADAASSPQQYSLQQPATASPVLGPSTAQLTAQLQQPVHIGSPSKGATNPALTTQQQQPQQQWPQSVTPQAVAGLHNAASVVPMQQQQDSWHTSTATTESAVAADAGSSGQRGRWLSLFAGRSDPQQQREQHQQQPAFQQPAGEATQQQPGQQQPGQFDSLLVYHQPTHSRQPSSPGQRPSPLIPQAVAALPLAAGPGKLPAPWVPGTTAAGSADQTAAAAGLPRQPWMPGVWPANPQQTAANAGMQGVAVAAPPLAASGYAGLSDGYLQRAPTPAAAGVVAHSSAQDSSKQQQQQQQSPELAGPSAQAAVSAYASLSDSSGGQPANRVVGSGSISSTSVQQQGSSMRPCDVTQASQGQQSPPPAGLVSEISLSPGGAAAAVAEAQQYAGMPSHSSTASDAASGLPAALQLRNQQQQQQQKHQLPNGSHTQPDNHSSFASLGTGNILANGIPTQSHAAAIGLPMGGPATGSTGVSAAPAGSVATNSIAGSGPPSNSGGFSAMSYIQAHAETSTRNSANLKLLQQHIDELTTEKLELMRGLQQQMKANEALAEENRALTEGQNGMGAKVERERQQVKQLNKEMEAAAASLAALVGQRDAFRAAAQDATDRANTLAAENVALENQLLELKSSSLRLEKEAKDATAAVSKLEAQRAQLGSAAGHQTQELQGLQTERRILKARLLQAEARMRSAGLDPLPPMPTAMTAADAEAASAVTKVDAEVQTDPQQQRYHLPLDVTALDPGVLQPTAAAIKTASRKLLDPVLMNEQAAAVLSGLEQWLPGELLSAAEAAIAAGSAARQQQHAGTKEAASADGQDADAVFNAAMSAAADVVTGGIGDEVWHEEARLAGSVTGLAEQLEGTWDNMVQELEQAQIRNAELQQQADELQEQLADLRHNFEQQQQLSQQYMVQAQHAQPQQQDVLQEQLQSADSSNTVPQDSSIKAVMQQHGGQQQQQSERHHQQDLNMHLQQRQQQQTSVHHQQLHHQQQQQQASAQCQCQLPVA